MQTEVSARLLDTTKRWMTLARLWFSDSLVSYPNTGNAAVELPTELLRDIFLLICIEDHPLANKYQKYPPAWISITYVCRRWRVVALSFQQLWSTVTPDLSPKWVLAFLKRSSHRPLRVCLNVGPVQNKPLRKRVRLGSRSPAAFLPDHTIRKVLSHASRIQELQVSGKGEDVIRMLKSLDKPTSLDSLSIRVRDGYCRDISPSRTPLTLPHTFLGGYARQLRHLHCWSGLHLTFPPWLLGSISELTVSMDFSLDRLFAVLRQTPQLKTLRISSPLTHFRQSDRALSPIHLNCLSSLVLETSSLGLFTTISTSLLLPPDVRRHLTLTLPTDGVEERLWSSFLTSLKEIITITPGSLHGIHFKWQRGTTYFYTWTTPVESLLSPSPWPPLDDVFSLQVRGPSSSFGFGCRSLNSSSSHDSSFHRLQELCVFLGRETVKELSVEYGTENYTFNRFQVPHHCWGTLLSGLPNVTTLRFGDGAAHLLISASCGTLTSPTELSRRNFPNLRRVQVTRGFLSTRTLWRWIQYATAPPTNMSRRELRKHIQSLLLRRCSSRAAHTFLRGTCEADFLDVTESLLVFLLHWRSRKVWVSELALPERGWDEPDCLEILQELLQMLDWDVVLDTGST
ncbi:hypothetical protein BJY52DRAFT_1217734 [Lactarius psammicola]|nr:hypothetical protein BJY52DRAFT_1217734 [Lactarius psammicola]